jgi:hypothetical protein
MHPWWPVLWHWPRFLDPISWWWLSTKGYALTSSWFNVAWVAVALTYMRRHNCHQHGCWRLQWHAHPEHGHPVCKKHYTDHPEGRIPGKEKPTNGR